MAFRRFLIRISQDSWLIFQYILILLQSQDGVNVVGIRHCREPDTEFLPLYNSLIILLHIGVFTIHPSSIIQAEGLNATFDCQDLDAFTIYWKVNGTSVISLPNVSSSEISGELERLTIAALPIYNGSNIQCCSVVSFSGNTHEEETSQAAYLIVQGELMV